MRNLRSLGLAGGGSWSWYASAARVNMQILAGRHTGTGFARMTVHLLSWEHRVHLRERSFVEVWFTLVCMAQAMGLRTVAGVSTALWQARAGRSLAETFGGAPMFDAARQQGLLELRPDVLCCTPRGLRVLDSLLPHLLLASEGT